MPTVRVKLPNGDYIQHEYLSTATTYELAAAVFPNKDPNSREVGVWEVCQENVQRLTRSYELVSDIVSTWDPDCKAHLRLDQGEHQLHYDTSISRLVGLSAVYSSFTHQDWNPCVIDIYDRLFHLRTAEYNGVWRALDLSEVDVYDTKTPETIVLRSQVAYEQLPDKVDRMLEIRVTPQDATRLRKLVHTIRTQFLIAPQSYTFNTQPVIGPPPSFPVPPPGPAPCRSIKQGIQGALDMHPGALRPPVCINATPRNLTPPPCSRAGVRVPPVVPTLTSTVKQTLAPALLLTPPTSPATSSYSQPAATMLPPPVPPKDGSRRRNKKRVARRICPVIEGEMVSAGQI